MCQSISMVRVHIISYREFLKKIRKLFAFTSGYLLNCRVFLLTFVSDFLYRPFRGKKLYVSHSNVHVICILYKYLIKLITLGIEYPHLYDSVPVFVYFGRQGI